MHRPALGSVIQQARRIALAVAACAALAPAAIASDAHTEWVVGFHGGTRSWGEVPFAWTGDDADGLAGATGPFDATPFQDTVVVGPALEVRQVAQPVRVVIGYRAAFPDWTGGQAPRARGQDGGRVPAAVGGAYAHELRLGLGLDGPELGPVTPFADLMGDLTIVRAQLQLDGEPHDVVALTYALTPRAGVRVALQRGAFVELAAEAGVFGPTGLGGHLVIGFSEW
ncbi:MAG: hypothetical protein ACI8PZ_003440 [Myxococcota bacterium]|jgi:hypothetical protein